MTAIIAGQGLGLLNTSLGLLGGQGQLGAAEQGRSGEKVLVNASTGNLVVQQQDEWLVGVGPDVGILRTYNSLASGDGDNGDNWRLGFARKITASGTFNQMGHTVVRTAEDGSEATYTYDVSRGKYINKDGGGSFDTLERSGGVWTWTDGSTQVSEVYETAVAVNTYRLKSVKDLDDKTIGLTYKATTDLISQIATNNGEVVEITYEVGTGKTANIQSIATKASSAGAQTLKRVTYLYDSAHRLQQVTVDLSPQDGSITDAKTYWTKYTYADATSRKLASLEQSDTSRLEFTYFTSGSWQDRINTVTDVRGTDRSRVTTFTYDLTGGVSTTTVKDALNQSTVLKYDASQLLSVTGPALGGVSQVTTYTYDPSGNVASVNDARGNTTVYQYDGNGNRIYERDEQGNVVQRVYGSKGQLLSETAFTGIDATPTGDTTLATGGLTTRYFYDAQNHLRFVVTPEGRVTQRIYNTSGQLQTTLQYTDTGSAGLFTASDVVNWTQDFSANASGLTATLPTGITRTGTGASGALTLNPNAMATAGSTAAVYGTTAHAMGTTWRAEFTTGTTISTDVLNLGIETGTFGEVGYRRYAINLSEDKIRLLTYKDDAISLVDMGAAAKGVTYVLEIVTQADGSGLLRVYEKNKEPSSGFTDLRGFTNWTQATLMVKTSKMGNTNAGSTIVLDNISAKVAPSYSDLATWADLRPATQRQRTDYTYDFRGQLNKQTTYAKVDAAGVGITADNSHNITQYTYDQAGNLLSTIVGLPGDTKTTSYAYDGLNRVKAYTDGAGNAATTVYVQSQTEYDDANLKTKVTMANGLVSTSTYDQGGRLLSVSQGDSGNASALGTTSYAYDKLGRLAMVTSPSGEKRFTLYDAASRKVGEIDAEGGLTQYIYNQSNQLVQTQRWSNKVSSSTLSALALDPSSGGLPANLLSNTMAGWTRGVDGAATSFSGGTNFNPDWTLSGETTPWLRQVGVEAISSYLSSADVLVTAGKSYEVSAYTGALRATANLEVVFYDGNGNKVGATATPTGGTVTNLAEKGGGNALASYKRLWGMVTVPAGATKARVIVRKAATNTGQTDSYLFVAHAYLGEAASTQSAVSGFDVRPVADATNDRTTRNIYDKAGRLIKTIDGLGAVVEYRYDGLGRLSDKVAYATLLDATQLTSIKNSSAELQASSGGNIVYTTASGTATTITVAADNLNDRRERSFYSTDGLVVGQLDGEGYYTANSYDNAGRLSKTIRYANAMSGVLADGNTPPAVVTATPQAAGTVLQDIAVLPLVSKDQVTQYNYNARGQLVGVVDAEGYYTSYEYDGAGNKSAQTRHAVRVSDAVGAPTPPSAVPSELKTNNVLQSQSFATAPWTAMAAGGGVAPVITGNMAAPDGSSTASRIVFTRSTTGVDDYSLVSQTFASTQATTSTNSIWVKSNTGANQTILLRGAGNWSTYSEITVGTQWTRIQVSGTGLAGFQFGLRKDGGAVNALSADILVWGAQNEAGPASTDYIATTNVAVTAAVKANNVLQSQNFAATPWAATAAGGGTVPAITANMAAPDGSTTASRVSFSRSTTAGDDYALLTQTFPFTQSSTATTNSIWVKSNSATPQSFLLRGEGGWGIYREFTVGPQWTRIEVTGTGLAGFQIGLRKGGGAVDALSADILIWGAQNEASSAATDYIATTTKVVTAVRQSDQKTLYKYDANNRLIRTESLATGLVTTCEYDVAGNLIKTTGALGSTRDERIEQTRYDKLGRVIGELGGVGSKAVKDYLANPANAGVSDADQKTAIDNIWNSYGTSHQYDEAGRRVLTIQPNGLNTAGLKTFYYYDKNGQLTHSVNALGEVAQYDYNTFGEQTAQTLYATRMATTGLSGGLKSTLGTVTGDAAKDTKTSQSYDQRGQVNYVMDALRLYYDSRSYNAFGELKAKSDHIDGTYSAPLGYEYDRRGLLVATKEFNRNNPNASGLRRTTRQSYDAFGRIVTTTDGLSRNTTLSYDRLGRQVATTDRSSAITRSTYDAFGRVLTLKDALGNSTTYSYDTANNKFTVTTPEQVSVVTELNLHGQTVKVTNGRSAPTTYEYNTDGQLTRTYNANGDTEQTWYDKAGRVYDTMDPRGVVTRHTYDSANRLLTRAVDPGGLNLTTTYSYDAQGRTAWVKDANGTYTQTEYDKKGQVTAVVVDPKKNPLWVSGGDNNPSGLALRTEYTYDSLGQQLTVTEGAGTAQAKTTQYIYDVLGRRIQDIVDPSGLALTTNYTYDDNDNLKTRVDANNTPKAAASQLVTRYLYDGENRQTYAVDPLGALSEFTYNADGKLTRTRKYAKALVNSAAMTDAQISSSTATLASTGDEITTYFYDKDGRQTHSMDALGYVTQNRFDAAGNITSTTRYAKPMAMPTEANRQGTLVNYTTPTSIPTDAKDRTEQTVYDGANRPVWHIDANGYATQSDFDRNGNLVKTTRYAKPLVFVTSGQSLLTQNRAPILGTSTVAGNSTIAPDADKDQTSYILYDKANRATFSIDAQGYVTQNTYDKLGRLKTSTRYANALVNAYVSDTEPLVLGTAPQSGTASYVLTSADDAATQYNYDTAGRRTEAIDALLVKTKTVYDAAGRVTDITQADGLTEASTTQHYVYDAAGRVTDEYRAYQTADQTITRYVLDSLGKRTKLIDPRGVELAEGTSQWAKDERQRLIGTTTAPAKSSDPASNYQKLLAAYTTQQTFDANGRITVSTDAASRTINTEYDAFGNAVKVTDPNGNPGYFYFDKLNQATWSVDPMGYAVQTEFDAFGQAIKITRYVAAVSGTLSTTVTPVAYDDQAAATAASATLYVLRTAGKDQTTQIEHDKLGRQTKITDAEGYVESMSYDGLGNKDSFTNKLGGVYTYTYWRNGLLKTEKLPEQAYAYDAAGNPTGSKQDVINYYEYDARGNRTKSVEAQGLLARTTLFTYDKLDRQLTKTGESMATYTTAAGTGSDVPVETRKYDARGNLIEVIDPVGARTLTYWDALDRKTAEIKALYAEGGKQYGALTAYDYNQSGDLIAQRAYAQAIELPATAGASRPAAANVLSGVTVRTVNYLFDANHRQISQTIVGNGEILVGEVNPVTGNYEVRTQDLSSSKQYDPAGNVVKDTDARGNVTWHYYDKLGNQLVQVDAERYVTAWTYDATGNVKTETKYALKLTEGVVLNTSVNPDTITTAVSGNAQDRKTEFVRDKLGRIKTQTLSSIESTTVNATTGGLTESTSSAITLFEYNGQNQLTRKTEATGEVLDWTYDKLGRMTRKEGAKFTDFEGTADVRQTTGMEYNALGLIARTAEYGKSGSADRYTRYFYSANGMASSEQKDLNATQKAITRYQYDLAGHVTSQSSDRTSAAGVTSTDVTTFSYDLAARQLKQAVYNLSGSNATLVNGTTYTAIQTQESKYDAYGNVVNKRTYGNTAPADTVWQEFAEYNLAGQMVRSNSGDGVVKAYVYDANGNATLKLTSAGADLKSGTVAQLIGAADVHQSISTFDKRNQTIQSIEAISTQAGDKKGIALLDHSSVNAENKLKISFGTLTAAIVNAATSPLADGQVEIYGPSLFVNANLSLRHFTNTLWQVNYISAQAGVDSRYGDGSIKYEIATSNITGTPPLIGYTLTGGTFYASPFSTISRYNDSLQHIKISQATPHGNITLFESDILVPGYFTQSVVPKREEISLSKNNLLPLEIHYKSQPKDTARLMMFYRSTTTPNVGWSIKEAGKLQIEGQEIDGWFVSKNWGDVPRGQYDIRYVALDASGNVLNSQTGTMNLQDTGPTIEQFAQTIGGAGKAFLDTSGFINLTELNTSASVAEVKVRTVGTSAWVSLPDLTPATINGSASAMPGWFKFNPASIPNFAYGNPGYEYIVSTKDANGNVLSKASGRFNMATSTIGTVDSALTGSANWASTVHFQNLPKDTATARVLYRTTGTSNTSIEQRLELSSPGSFDWVTFEAFPANLTSALDYEIQAFDANGQLLHDSTGKVKVGAVNELIANSTANAAPAVGTVIFKPPVATGAVPATMKVYYRAAGSTGAYSAPVALTVGANGQFSFNASSLLPSDTISGQWDYYYEVFNSSSVKLSDASQPTLAVPGRLGLGTPARPAAQSVLLGVANNAQVSRTSQTVNAFGDVIEQVDALGRITTLRYNSMGKLLEKQDPLVEVTGENGTTLTGQRPSTRYYYDLQGRLVATKDANGYTTSQLLLEAGEGQSIVKKEFHPDNGIKRNGYDVFGDLRYVGDELSTSDTDTAHRTSFEYDKAHRLVKLTRPQRADMSVAGYDLYSYDQAGNRIQHQTSSDGATTGTTVFTDTATFDALGRTTRTDSAASRWITYDYVYDASIKGVNDVAVGGWRLTTTNSNLANNVLVDYNEIFGRKTRHIDLSGRDFSYRYSVAGWLVNQSRTDVAGQNIDYAYYADGRIKSLTDNAANTYTLYEYDRAGNKTYEGYATRSGSTWNFYQQATITYDALNRVKSVVDPQYRIEYQYDAVGNRRHLTAYKGSSNTATQDYWYAYDNMNRFVVTMGKLSGTAGATGTTIVEGSSGDGVHVYYNAVGLRTRVDVARDGHREDYEYTADGFLQTSYLNANTSAKGARVSLRTSDLLGRVSAYTEYEAGGAVKAATSRTYLYDEDGKVEEDNSDGTKTTYTMFNDGTVKQTTSVKGTYTNTTYNAYQWWDDAKQLAITTQEYNPSINKNQNAWKPGTSYFEYDVNGHAKSVEDVVGNRSLRYVTNAQGLIMVRDEIANQTVNKTQNFFYFDGARIGEVGNDATASNVDYAQALAKQPVDRKTAYKNWKPIATSDFDQNYTPISPTYPGFTSAGYTAQGGERLQDVAQAVWGDASLWYMLADANGLTSTTPLVAGQTLVIPNKVTNVHNNSTTKAVYNPAEAMGDTSPTVPDAPKPPKKGCGGVGMILMVIVAVVATIFTAGAAIALFAPGLMAAGGIMATGMAALGGTLVGAGAAAAGLAAAVVGGAVGSIASQLVGMATGDVEKFSWSSVAIGAISAGAGAGAGSVIGAAAAGASPAVQLGFAVAKAVAGNVIGQGVAQAVHLQKKFSWTSVAASAAGAAASFGAGRALGATGFSTGTEFGDRVAYGTVSGMASGWAGAMVRHDKPNWSAIAAQSFGSALGDALAQEIVKSVPLPLIKQRDNSNKKAALAKPTGDFKSVARRVAEAQGLQADDGVYRPEDDQPKLLTVADRAEKATSASEPGYAQRAKLAFSEDNLKALPGLKIEGAGDEGLVRSMTALQGSRDANTGEWRLGLSVDEVNGHLQTIATARGVSVETINADYQRFQLLVIEREAKALQMEGFRAGPFKEGADGETRVPLLSMSNENGMPDHGAHMGSNDQLRFGKIVGDILGIDPVFGALLSPTGGIAGAGNVEVSDRMYKFGGGKEVVTNHGIAHDAGGFLLNYYGVGPGYQYVPHTVNFLSRTNPLAGQVNGLNFFLNMKRYGSPNPPPQTEGF